jgi:uncharacterized protein (DUF1778 family)
MIKEKKKKEKRNVEIKIRLTAEEKEEIKRLAKEEGLTISQYIRTQALKKKKGKIQTREMKELIYEVNKIGINLNQMARALNVLRNKKGELEDKDKKLLEAIKLRLEKVEGVLKDVFGCSNNQNEKRSKKRASVSDEERTGRNTHW